jgi:uncharacterized protein
MLISVRVIPRSKKNSLEWEEGEEGEEGKGGGRGVRREGEGGMLRVRLTAAPVDGAANEALVALLAGRLGVSKRRVVIVRGATSRQKVVEIVDVSLEDLKSKLAQ